jgi:hypothetical protein
VISIEDSLFGCLERHIIISFGKGGPERKKARIPAACGSTLSIEHHRTPARFGVSKRRSRGIIWSFILDVVGFLIMTSQGL